MAQRLTCVLHLIRNTFRLASRADWDKMARDLRPVYTAVNEADATARLDEFHTIWGDRYPAIRSLWIAAWGEFVPFLDYSPEIRRMIYSTDDIVNTDDALLWDCGDFEIWDDAVLRYRVKEFYDKNGDFEKVMVHGWFTERFYNATTGKSFEGGTNGYNFSESADAPGAWIHHGLMYHATIPGVGRVLVDAGYFIMQDPWLYDDWHDSITWQRGNHQNIDGDYDKFCAALR